MKSIFQVVLLTIAVAPLATVSAAEQMNNCRLRAGSMVMLSPEACVLEGGIVTTAAAALPAVTAVTLNLSAEPKLADAQRAVANLLAKPVVDMDMKKRIPERIERSVKFDGCRMAVEENIDVDHGNLFSSRISFKVSSTIDLRNIANDAYSVLGKVTSYGGGLKSYPVSFVEKHSDANNIAISISEQKEDGARKYELHSSSAYWDAPNADLWMADKYGYPKSDGPDNAETSKIRVLYFMSNHEEAAALKKAFDDLHALCMR
ncbi:MAG: hypothetical protein PHI29_00860 [Gallionella sp.]|nr:hypothetical protein [Gallionella sp.]